MKTVYDELSKVIESWCGLPEGSYGPGRTLRKMWVAQMGVGEPYYTEGVRSLLEALYARKFFRACPRAQDLRYTMFKPEAGGIQSFADLHDHLRSCGEA
jgi:hypothetical protein